MRQVLELFALAATVAVASSAHGAASYVGGSGNEITTQAAVHPLNGDVYVTGTTTSTDFPGIAGAAGVLLLASLRLRAGRAGPARQVLR